MALLPFCQKCVIILWNFNIADDNYTANNGSRFHVVEGCCNAYVPMELGQALADDRFGCPCCCERNLIIFEMKQHGTYKEGMKVTSYVDSEEDTEESAS